MRRTSGHPHMHTFGSEALSSLSDCRTICLSTPPTRSSTGTTVMKFLNLRAAAVQLSMLQVAMLQVPERANCSAWAGLAAAGEVCSGCQIPVGRLACTRHPTVHCMHRWHPAEHMHRCQASAGDSLGAVPASHGDLSRGARVWDAPVSHGRLQLLHGWVLHVAALQVTKPQTAGIGPQQLLGPAPAIPSGSSQALQACHCP